MKIPKLSVCPPLTYQNIYQNFKVYGLLAV